MLGILVVGLGAVCVFSVSVLEVLLVPITFLRSVIELVPVALGAGANVTVIVGSATASCNFADAVTGTGAETRAGVEAGSTGFLASFLGFALLLTEAIRLIPSILPLAPNLKGSAIFYVVSVKPQRWS